MTEFVNLGNHCSLHNCNQHDFLPFVCDCCDKVFCLSHRSYKEHECPNSGSRSVTAIVCPLCKQTIRMTEDQDANVQWEIHSQNCQPTAQKPKQPKKRCIAEGCRAAMGPTNTHQCSGCGGTTCLSHRYADAHACKVVRTNRWTAPPATAPVVAKAAPRPTSAKGRGKKKASPRAADQSNTLRGSADRRRASNTNTSSHAPGGNSMNMNGSTHSNGSSASAHTNAYGSEVCEVCSARFSTLSALISHAETAHTHNTGANSSTARGGGDGSCPYCNIVFVDPVLLVEHVEEEHANATSAARFQPERRRVSAGTNCSVG